MRRSEVQARIDMLDNYDRNGELTDEERANLWMMKKLFQLTKDEKEEEEPVVRFYDIETMPGPIAGWNLAPGAINWYGQQADARPAEPQPEQDVPEWFNLDVVRHVDRNEPQHDIAHWTIGYRGIANEDYITYLWDNDIRNNYVIINQHIYQDRLYFQVERVA